MVIQRIQSLLLLIAAILMVVFCFVIPVASFSHAIYPESFCPLYIKDITVLLTMDLIIAVLLVVDIFLYKNLKQQMSTTMLTIMLQIVSIAVTAFVLVSRLPAGAEAMWLGFGIVSPVSLVLTLAAWYRMRADQRLLRSYDRLR